jgi:hypothetical protein
MTDRERIASAFEADIAFTRRYCESKNDMDGVLVKSIERRRDEWLATRTDADDVVPMPPTIHPRPWRTSEYYDDQCTIVDADDQPIIWTQGSDLSWLDKDIAALIVDAVNAYSPPGETA